MNKRSLISTTNLEFSKVEVLSRTTRCGGDDRRLRTMDTFRVEGEITHETCLMRRRTSKIPHGLMGNLHVFLGFGLRNTAGRGAIDDRMKLP
jgi:hypothetical protein